MDRGIFSTIMRAQSGNIQKPSDRIVPSYMQHAFCRVMSRIPTTKDSAFTNFFDVTVRVARAHFVLCCLDNLIKGAAGAACRISPDEQLA